MEGVSTHAVDSSCGGGAPVGWAATASLRGFAMSSLASFCEVSGGQSVQGRAALDTSPERTTL